MVVVVAKDGAVSVGKDPVSRDELAATVKARLGESNGVVQLRGDKEAAYGDVVSVMDELAANGVTRIAIVSSGRRSASAPPPPAPAAMTDATLGGRAFEPPTLESALASPGGRSRSSSRSTPPRSRSCHISRRSRPSRRGK